VLTKDPPEAPRPAPQPDRPSSAPARSNRIDREANASQSFKPQQSQTPRQVRSFYSSWFGIKLALLCMLP